MAYDFDRLNTDDHGSSFLMGLLAGTVLGAGLGMLFAPRTGSELRQQISDSANRLQRTASEKYEEASGRMNEVVNRGRDAYEHLVHKGRDAMEKGREAYQEAAGRASETFANREPTKPSPSFSGTTGT